MQRRNRLLPEMGRIIAVVFASLALAVSGRGDVIYTGNGAGAVVTYVGGAGAVNYSEARQQGTTPAVTGGTATVNYTNSGYPIISGAIVGTEQGSALATPGGATLLQLSTSFVSSSPDPGSLVGAVNPSPRLNANAYWDNVAATVQAPAVQALPNSIRLQFQINYQSPSVIDQYGQSPYFSPGQALLVSRYPLTLTEAGMPLQPGELAVRAQPDGSLTGSFHLDLPLSPSGTSQLFSLGLSSDLEMFNIMYHWPGTLKETMSLLLTGIYVPDGTPISADGYSVTLDSGLTPPPSPPQFVPEPATVAIWCLLAACGARIFRRGRGKTNAPAS